jgi:predicted kinase
MLTPGGTEQELSQDTAALRQALEADLHQYPAQSPSGPFLVVLSGLPGTGKSHFARELVKRVPFLILGSDRLRKALVSQPRYTREEHLRVFAACHCLVEELLAEGYRVIFDATNLTEGFRQPLYDIAGRRGAPLALVRFTAPLEVIRRRLDERAAGLRSDSYSDADWLVYCRLCPGEEPIERPHFVVDSSQDIYPILEEVVRWFSAPSFPGGRQTRSKNQSGS